METQILAAIPGIFLCLFIGPWSDSNGRKLVMMAPLMGGFLTNLILLLLTYFKQSMAEYYMFTAIYGFFGGFACFLTGAFSYISDISKMETRTSRIALVDFTLFAGFPLGTALSGIIYGHFGYYAVFGTALAMEATNLVYFGFFVHETIGRHATHPITREEQTMLGSPRDLKSLLAWQNLASVFKTCLKKRPQKKRRIILLLITAMLLLCALFSKISKT